MKRTPETLLDVVDELDHTIDLLCCVQTCMDVDTPAHKRGVHVPAADWETALRTARRGPGLRKRQRGKSVNSQHTTQQMCKTEV